MGSTLTVQLINKNKMEKASEQLAALLWKTVESMRKAVSVIRWHYYSKLTAAMAA